MKTEPIDVCQTLKPVAMIRMLVMTMLVVNIIQVIDISTNVFVFTIIIIGIIFVNEVYWFIASILATGYCAQLLQSIYQPSGEKKTENEISLWPLPKLF